MVAAAVAMPVEVSAVNECRNTGQPVIMLVSLVESRAVLHCMHLDACSTTSWYPCVPRNS